MKVSPPPSPDEPEEEIVTQDTEDAPIIEKPKTEIKKQKTESKTEVKEIVKEEPQVNPAALYKGKSSKATGNTGEGITGTPGDQGNPNGTPDSDNYSGTGGYRRWSFIQPGRQISKISTQAFQ